MPMIELAGGPIEYERSGPREGRPVVFVHGYQMSASLWRPLSERMAERGFACVAPTWPLGAHRQPMRHDADLTMEGIAAMVGELLDLLAFEDVVLVGNDTGGAIAQIVATTRPQRLGSLVLTSCDAFERFPPAILKPLIAAAKLGPAYTAAIQPLRTRIGRNVGFGALAHADIDHLVREWTGPALSDRRIRRDLRRFTASMNRRSTVTAAAGLPRFTRPTLIAWSADDAFFPLTDGRRLANALPDSRLEVIQRSRTFSMIDQPDRLTELIADFGTRARPQPRPNEAAHRSTESGPLVLRRQP